MTAGINAIGSTRSIALATVAGWLLLPGMSLASSATAGSFKVSPVQINLPPDRPAALLKMTNSDAAPVSVRVVTHSWTQVDGEDVYGPTSNLIVSPPIFTISPGATQHIRVGLRNRTLSGAYRVIFEEIPRDKPADGQVQITVRLNLPLYVLPKGKSAPDVQWTAWRDRAGEVIVEGSNRGSLHSQVVEIAADQAGRRHVLTTNMGVVLPGSSRRWKIGKRPELAAGMPLLLSVKGSAGETRTPITLERR